MKRKNKRNILLLCICIFLLAVCLYTKYSNRFVNYDEYIKNVIFDDKEILNDKTYIVENLNFKARIIYPDKGTYVRVYDNPNQDEIICELKYFTRINPIEIIKTNGDIWVKIETKDNRVGWICSNYIEVHISMVKRGSVPAT